MIYPIQNGDVTQTLNGFFRNLLEKQVVDALLVPQIVYSGKSVIHTLIKDPDQIKHAAPFLPLLMNNGASAAAALTAWEPKEKLGVVLRACEIRTLIELVKFKQAGLGQLFLIGVDCLGTLEAGEFEKMLENEGEFKLEQYLAAQLADKQENSRMSCQVCPYPVPDNVEMNIGFIGSDLKKGFIVDTSEEIAGRLGISGDENGSDRKTDIAEITDKKQQKKEVLLAELKERYATVEDLLNEFARCKRCYNCRAECPICYCKECVFLTNVFTHKPEDYLRWADRKGAIKMPYDTLLFHLTRLNHMVTSCVECGMCSSACPNGLPVFELFLYVGQDVQALFDYVPGKDVNESPPLNTFKEAELENYG